MKKILFFVLLFATLSLVIVFSANAQEATSSLKTINTQTMSSGDLGIKNVGMLPTNPFYFLKNWGRGINKFFTFDPVKKAGLELREINERAMEIKKIEETAPQNIKAINQASSNYQKSADQLKNRLETLKQTSQNPNVDKILNNLVDSSIKHQELFSDLEKKIEANQGISESGITELKKSFKASRGSIDGASNMAKNTLYQIYTEQKISAGVNPIQRTSTEGEPAIGNMPNPASVYCVKQGGKLEIRKDKQENEYGICIFSDGSECEEWAFFRGKCGGNYKNNEKSSELKEQNLTGQDAFIRQNGSSLNKNEPNLKCPTLVPPSPDSCKNGKWITEKTSAGGGCPIFKCIENYKQEVIPSISEKDLENGWYYGQKFQKKSDTPKDWVWQSAGKSSKWLAPSFIEKQENKKWCGDEKCDEPSENVFVCYEDCKPKPPEPTKPMLHCGDGICQENEGENVFICNKDCKQQAPEQPKPILHCGDGICQENEGENVFICNKDCKPYPNCGDGICDENENENFLTCPKDCK
ncbi:MAG: DUF333 domain-containing protein [Candidatus Kuenenbacteria bacterium]